MARILVVEDSAAMRSYIRAALEEPPGDGGAAGAAWQRDIEVVEAASGFDALRLLPRGPYDLVITDINMPDINGLELIKFVRDSEHLRKVAVMIISTQSSDRDRERGLALGADAFLAKPFSPEALRQTVASSLGARSLGTGAVGAAHTSSPAGRGEQKR
jgi:two-component system, chemotaxis family, chemotaxis protein CheY